MVDVAPRHVNDGSLQQRLGDLRYAETGTCPGIGWWHIDDIRPAADNDLIYGVTDPDDPALDDLVASIRRNGLRDAIVVSRDHFVLSGHRRLAACKRIGVRFLFVQFEDVFSGTPEFVRKLVEYNPQRDKTPDVRVREQLALINPDDAHRALVTQRVEAAKVKTVPLVLGDRRKRTKISRWKQPFLAAVRGILDRLEDFWPLSDRKVHYELLNAPPLISSNKPDSRYRNDKPSYKALTDRLLTPARIEGLIPFEAIGDETRPVTVWDVFPNLSPFVKKEADAFLTGYWRDLMQGQPNHVEVLGEKNTIGPVLKPVAEYFTIPLTIGRGYSSLPPRKSMYDRYKASGKENLIVLCVTDHDPEGWDIAESFAKSMRDDFGVRKIHAVKVALRPEQAASLGLPQNEDVKTKSSRYKKFARRFGHSVWELEAVKAETLQAWLREAILANIDVPTFNAQVESEKAEARTLEAHKRAASQFLMRMAATAGGAK